MLFGVGLALMNAIVLINVGQVGVQHFVGKVKQVPLEQGVHFVSPLASIEKMSVREQAFPIDGGIESIEEKLQREQQVAAERFQTAIIQELSEMPEGTVVNVPTEGAIPLIRSLGGGR